MTEASAEDLPIFHRFAHQHDFPFDQFQIDGCHAIERGRGVLVSAPTGSGKTIVGEFAVFLALETGKRCFYTTPIKALSNQKYNDLRATYGDDRVGLMTGDVSINRDADVIVMTTEVLRNMIYADEDSLDNLSHVVMDEVHYLADPERGPVWEEIILNLDESVSIVALSATVSNIEQFGEWIKMTRGDTNIIVWEHRPVPLHQYMLVGNSIIPLFSQDNDDATQELSAPINPELVSRCATAERRSNGRRKRPHRPAVIGQLQAASMLPAIIFIFSRAGCEGALAQCYTARVQLTTRDEAREILSIIDADTADIPQEDLDLMGFRRWRTNLSRGIAAHHAGMLPAFRRIVEKLFVRGLLKVVFATETLALGINMPARTVVLESLVKFNGEAHVDLTPAQYTQLTGRAGRRGIDVLGNAVVLWQPSMDPEAVAGLASTRTYPLISTFLPGYNMSVNLLNTLGVEKSHRLLERSFAQFLANEDVVARAHERRAHQRHADSQHDELLELLGHRSENKLPEYVAIRRNLSHEEKKTQAENRKERFKEISRCLGSLTVGDVIALPEGRNPALAVCVRAAGAGKGSKEKHRHDSSRHYRGRRRHHDRETPDTDSQDPRPMVITEDGRVGQLHADELGNVPMTVGRMRLPRDVSRHPKRARSLVRSEFRRQSFHRPRSLKPKARVRKNATIKSLRKELRAHPVHKWENREELVRAYARLASTREKIADQSDTQSGSGASGRVLDADTLVSTFDRMIALLREMDYVDPSIDDEPGAVASRDEAQEGSDDAHDLSLTEEGLRLARIHNQSDLLIAQCLRRKIWDDLDPAELAGVVSTCVFENRKSVPGDVEVPTQPLATAIENTERLWEEIVTDEERHHLPMTRPIETELATAMHQWTAGAPLSYCVQAAAANGTSLTPGDFVRSCRQVIDVLNQIKTAGYSNDIRAHARQAVEAMRRGVVAMGS